MFQYQMWQRFEVWVPMVVCIWCTFSCVSDREDCLAEVWFSSREDLNSCKFTLDKHRITSTFNLTWICVRGWISCYFLRFTQHKVSSNVNDKVFSGFIKKEKTLYLGGSVVDRLTKYISTLAFNPNLGSRVCIWLCGSFSLCGNSVFILFISLKLFNLNLIL